MAIDAFYPQIDVIEIVSTGERFPVAGTSVEFYNITRDETIDTIIADADGIIAEGGFDSLITGAEPGHIVELRHDEKSGKMRLVLQSTQEKAYTASVNDGAAYVLADAYSTVAPEFAVIMAEDLNEPLAPPFEIGVVKIGEPALLPFQSPVEKNLRLYAVPKTDELAFSQNDLSGLNGTDIIIPGTDNEHPVTIFDEVTDRATTATASETLYDQIIPANTLTHNGDAIKYEAAGTLAANGNDKIVWLVVGATTIGASDTITANNKGWVADGVLIREDSDTLKYSLELTVDGGTLIVKSGKINALDFTADIDFLLNGRTPTQAGDLTAYFWKAYKIPAADVTPPSVPGGFTATAQDDDSILWEWDS